MGKLQVEQSNKKFVFTIDDNVRFLREIVEENFLSIFSHPYLKMLRELHCSFGVKVQLNVFFEDSLGFDLSMMPDKYRDEWSSLNGWEVIKIMIHEQYFYKDYFAYQPDFEEKLISTFSWLKTNGYESVFFEDIVWFFSLFLRILSKIVDNACLFVV